MLIIIRRAPQQQLQRNPEPKYSRTYLQRQIKNHTNQQLQFSSPNAKESLTFSLQKTNTKHKKTREANTAFQRQPLPTAIEEQLA